MQAGKTSSSQARRDRRAAEVAHVGVERLGARDRQHDGGEREERGREVVDEEVQRRTSATAPRGSPGARRCRATPHAAMPTNQTSMTGPNSRPTAAVPEPLQQEQDDDDRRGDRDDEVLQRRRDDLRAPSTADSTEIAGVIMLSPKNSDAPKIPSAASTQLRPRAARDAARAGSA